MHVNADDDERSLGSCCCCSWRILTAVMLLQCSRQPSVTFDSLQLSVLLNSLVVCAGAPQLPIISLRLERSNWQICQKFYEKMPSLITVCLSNFQTNRLFFSSFICWCSIWLCSMLYKNRVLRSGLISLIETYCNENYLISKLHNIIMSHVQCIVL